MHLQGPSLTQTILHYTPLAVRNSPLVFEFVRQHFPLVRGRSNLFLPSVNTNIILKIQLLIYFVNSIEIASHSSEQTLHANLTEQSRVRKDFYVLQRVYSVKRCTMKRTSWGYLWCICLYALLVRVLVARWPYSGKRKGQLGELGDFEAQRHWMEVTLNLPLGKWYSYDLDHWGIDYPPLTAYVSMICGMIAHWIYPESVALLSSRGEESPQTVALMRGFVILCELLTWFPAALIMAWYLDSSVLLFKGHKKRTGLWLFAIVGAALFQPGSVLIDHAHHQYNCVSLGLALGAVAGIHRDHDLLGAVLFSLRYTSSWLVLFCT